jgi:amino acid adenylation domain-containing protein
MHALRRIATDAGCALIFDEVVTGFRVAPGGAQEFYGVRADICTYGKIIGGGLPLAAIAGSADWLDALDGGDWQYGDDSYPEAGVTYFAGTFVRHPLALAAAKAALLHLKRRGPDLYREINDRTQRMVDRLNAMFAARRAPVQAVHCTSLWRLAWDDGQKYVGFFYYLLRFHGLHVYEQFGHFVTEAMGEVHTQRIVDVFTRALDELLALGLIVPRIGSGPSGGGGGGRGIEGHPTSADALQTQPSAGPLTPGQTERWLAGAFDPAARRALNESLCISLTGAVDMPALHQALQDVLSRHEAFRVSFDADEPLQKLGPPDAMAVAEVDLRGEADAATALDQFCAQASERDFPYDQAPLAVASVLRLSDGRVVVHLVASHLVFDGWASSVFNSELALAYKARAVGDVPQFAPSESPLAFAQQEQLRMQGVEGQEALAFWKSVLSNPPAQPLLGDLPPPTVRRYSANTVRASVDGDAWASARSAARAAGCTLFQFLLSALTVLLQRRSQQLEFVISIPYASQGLARHGPLMADGVLDLPLRLGCRPEETGLAVVQRVRSHLMDALDHPLATQGTIARALGIRSTGDKPPFTSIFFNLNPKIELSDFSPLVAAMHEGRKRGTLSELFFNFYEKENSLSLDLHYSCETYSERCAQALVDDLLVVFAHLARDPQAIIGRIALGSGKPTQTVDPRLLIWNATDCPLAASSRVEQWVSQQAVVSPHAPAITSGASTLTYAQLETQANQFGQLLKSMGIGPGALVGLCLGRGPDLLPALLGVLKCGAGYVPLDPGFPAERLRYMAQDADVALVITESQHAGLAGLPREKQLRVDDDAQRIAHASSSPLRADPNWQSDAIAYVIYTSGSTGQPKGVVLGQQSVCNFLASMRRRPGLNAGDKLLAVTTLSFDIAVLELLLPLTVGAHIVLAQREEAMDGEVLTGMVRSHGITVMQATPTTWHVLLDAGWRAPPQFRALCGGEPLPPSLASRLLDQGIELWNMYGPTETTVWSTLSKVYNPATHAITIGTPIDNTQVWVLDEALQIVPVGREGEICIGGLGVAHGYFKRPELTADRFVPDPFSPVAGARMYRTGDLGRWSEAGTIEHLGRLDYQVKIRGYRIELGEIEARLAAHPSVARAVALARELVPGDVRLVAYVLARPGATLEVLALRESLRLKLPDYMVPQHVIALDAMPLLPNGKIDRKALPAPEPMTSSAAVTSEPPRTELERCVANAMQSVLKISGIGAKDDFFVLGGHSLLAARLVAQLNRELGLQLALKVLFESPTVEQLARTIGLQQGITGPQRAPIVARDIQDTAPLTLMQERMHFVERMLGGSVAYNAPSCHRLTGPMNLEAFERAFQEMVRRQPCLRTRIVRTADGTYLQEVQTEVVTSLLPLSDLSDLAHAQREAVLAAELDALAREAFDLEHSPLFKAKLFKLAPHEHALYFCCHHIVWDGWSFDILYAEMSTLYGAYSQGVQPVLSKLALTYGDFAQWHQSWLQTEEIKEQLSFWKHQFATAPAVRVPVSDLPRLKKGLGGGASEFMHIPNARVEQLREVARRTGSTLSIVALSVYAAVVSQWLDEPMPAIGLPVRGRPSPELESVMGFFNNMLPLRLRVEPSLSAIELIAQVRSAVTLAFANQDVPFELLAQCTPGLLYQAMFSFQDARARQTHWGSLAHERIAVMHKGASEDLNLWMVEIPDGIEAGVQYNSDVFLPSTARALGERFVLALQRLVERPEQPVCELLRPSGAEQLRLNTWGQSQVNTTASHGLLQWVDEYCAQNPHAMAWRQRERSFTRIQLQQAVQQVQALVAPHIQYGRDVVVLVGHTAVIQGLAALAVFACSARVLCLQAPLSQGDMGILAARTDLAAVIAASAGALVLPEPVVQVDICAIVSSLGLKNTSTGVDMLPTTRAKPTVALDLPTVTALLANARALVPLEAGEVVLAVEGEDVGRLLAWTLTTWASGAMWKSLDAKDLTPSNQLSGYVKRHRPRQIHAPWKDLHDLVVMSSNSAPLVAWGDAATMTIPLASDLRSRGLQVVVELYLDGMSVPVAAQSVDDLVFNGICGRPLLSGKLSVQDAQGQLVPLGVAGQLRWELGTTVAVGTDFSYRWRSDGVLQRMFNLAKDCQEHRDGVFAREPKVAPRSDAEAALCEIWGELLARTDIGVTDDFFRLGGHSMLAMRMMGLIHQRMGRQLPVSALLTAPTIRLLALRLTSQILSDSLVLIRPGDHTKSALFLIHDGDGEILLYRNLALRMAPDRAVYGLQPLSSDGLAMKHTRIRDMAQYYVATIRRVQPHGPYMVGGLCAGGVIAFEVACQLEALGEPVAMTAILDIGDVHAPVRHALQARQRLMRFASVFYNADGARLGVHLKRIVSLLVGKVKNYRSYTQSTRALEAVVRGQAQRLQVHLDRHEKPADELTKLTVRQLYCFARDSYTPENVLRGDLVLFRAMQGDGSRADMPGIEMYADAHFGWPARISGTLRCFDVLGGHSTMLQEPHVDVLAMRMQAEIDRVDALILFPFR